VNILAAEDGLDRLADKGAQGWTIVNDQK